MLDLYVKTYYLIGKVEKAQGKFCGIDFENRLISGDVTFIFKAIKSIEKNV